MSSITNPINVGLSSNPWLSGIEWGGNRWYTPSSPTQTVIVYAPATGGNAPSAVEAQAFQQVFADISKICNITFTLGTTATADIVLSSVTSGQMQTISGDASALGYADPPAEYYDAALGDYQSTVFVNRDQYTGGALAPNSLYKGGYDYITWLHEIGHALGLAHPHDNGGGSTIYPGVTSAFGSYGTAGLNQGIFTTMGYNDGWQYFAPSLPQQYGWQSTMMAFDVAALQYLYGANYSTATGSDGYVLKDSYGYGAGWQCIWDAAGSDYLYYGGNYAVLLDLRAATLDPSGSYGAGGFVSYVLNAGVSYSGFTIANGVTIESAFSGNGNDTVIGNASNNVLYTYSGNDTIYGLEGNDFIWGGAGSDAIYAGTGADTLSGSWGSDTYYGGGDSDGFYLNQDLIAGDFDYLADLTYTIDYVILPTAYQGSVYFYVYNGAAYGYLTVGGGAYVFGAAGLTAAQLQASTFFYG